MLYSSRIIKAGALARRHEDAAFALGPVDASVRGNLDRIRRENVFGKASRSRVEDILAIFRQRYLAEAEVIKALVVLVKRQTASGQPSTASCTSMPHGPTGCCTMS